MRKTKGLESAFQGLKTRVPDEFDFSVVLQDMGKFTLGPYMERYYDFDQEIDSDDLKRIPLNVDIVETDCCVQPPSKGSTFIRFSGAHSPIWLGKTDLTFKGDIIPYQVTKQLKELIKKAIRDLDLKGKNDTLTLQRQIWIIPM